jgi:hypothetical protein
VASTKTVLGKGVPSPQKLKDLMNSTVNEKSMKTLGYLWSRWQDEKEYEDWNDYVKELSKLVPVGAENVTYSKHPFGITFELCEGNFRGKYTINYTSKGGGWERKY